MYIFFLLIRIRPYKLFSKEFIIRTVFSVFALYASDAKHVWMIFIFSFIVAWFQAKVNKSIRFLSQLF